MNAPVLLLHGDRDELIPVAHAERQVHAIKRRVLPSGKVSFDAERNARGRAHKFWAVALVCQKERSASRPRIGEIGVRLLG